MDIKNQRRDASSGASVEGMYPQDGKKGHGSASSDNNIGWDVRAQSWQRGADTCYASIEAEKQENDERFGIPHGDCLPNPADSNSDGNAPLPNPHNFSNNPGFMGGGMPMSTARSLRPGSYAGGREAGGGRVSGSTAVAKPNPTIGRTPALGHGSIAMPDQQQTDPGSKSDMAPQVVTTGFGG